MNNIIKMGTEVSISLLHRFLDLKIKNKKSNKLDWFRLVRFGFEPSQTRSDTFSVSSVLSEPFAPITYKSYKITFCPPNIV